MGAVDVIEFGDIGGDEDLARRVLSYARSIAPIDQIVDYELRKDAIAILRAAAKAGAERGSMLIANQRIAAAGVTYREVSSWFTDDDRNALRTICNSSSSSPTGPGPVGHFPKPSRVLGAIWPEHYDEN